jgi:hypothetical protein
MRKIVLSLATISLLALTSCKKDWTCECTTTTMGVSASASTTINDTKSNAEEACEQGSTSSNFGGVESKTECKIID